MTRIGYARVSSASQSYDEQAARLRAAGCEVVRCEKQSAATAHDRRELEIVLSFLRAGDQLVATKLDRVARSVRDLLDILARVEAAGAALVILDQGYDFSTPHGRLVATILGAVAEMERTLIRDRTSEGRAAARRDGRSLGGRRPTIDRASVEALWNAVPRIPVAEIARRLRIGESSVYRIMGEKEKPQ